MKRELGIANCGLACCLCSENASCPGCRAEGCMDRDTRENRRCAASRGLAGCYACEETGCRKGLLGKIKPYAFCQFIRRYGQDALLDCLARNEQAGVIYHRSGINGDYDDFDDANALIAFIRTGQRA